MSRRKKWMYLRAPESRYGLMICTVCKEKIRSGDYRCYETSEAYHSQHRACSEGSPAWAELDAERVARRAELQAKRAEFEAFRAKWGPCGLDYEIDRMADLIQQYDAILGSQLPVIAHEAQERGAGQ